MFSHFTLGARDEGRPGPRPGYGPNYCGAHVRDRDGNKLHFVCRSDASNVTH